VDASVGAVQYFQQVTGGLIVFEGSLDIPRFAHSAIEEYLAASISGNAWAAYRRPMGGRWLSTRRYISLPGSATGLRNPPYNHATFAKTCLKLLSEEMFNFGSHGPSIQEVQTLAFRCEFSKYAAVYWGAHVRLHCTELDTQDWEDQKFEELTSSVANFLNDFAKFKTSLVIAQYLQESREDMEHPLIKLSSSRSASEVADSFGFPRTVMKKVHST
jgi:hypothetical protein